MSAFLKRCALSVVGCASRQANQYWDKCIFTSLYLVWSHSRANQYWDKCIFTSLYLVWSHSRANRPGVSRLIHKKSALVCLSLSNSP